MDSWLDLNTVNLLSRVDSRIDKNQLIACIARDYDLGTVVQFSQIHEGFEDYNICLRTTKGSYLVKLFSQFKSFRHVKDNIQGLIAFDKAGVRVPRLYRSRGGGYLYYYEAGEAMALGCVMEYFPGRSFLKCKKEPTISQIKEIIREIVKINKVPFRPKGTYDVWMVQNLLFEFEKKRRFLSPTDLKLIRPVIQAMQGFDFSQCTRGTIHGDMQRSNVLISKKGEIRIIDFSVMDYHAIAIELATFLALFCIDPQRAKPDHAIEIYRVVLEEYLKYRKLRAYDLKLIPGLMLGTYAANNLAASFELRGKGNDTAETDYWMKLGREGMRFLGKIMKDLERVRF